MSKYFMVQHNVTNSDFYAEHVADMIAGTPALGPVSELNTQLSIRIHNAFLFGFSLGFRVCRYILTQLNSGPVHAYHGTNRA